MYARAGALVQYSVFMTRDMRGAYAAVDLVKHYRGDVMLFQGQRVELDAESVT